VGVSPDGKKVYLANVETDNVTVIDTATNTVIGFIPDARTGKLLRPERVAALVQQFRGLNSAAVALGFSSVSALQNAIIAFCGG